MASLKQGSAGWVCFRRNRRLSSGWDVGRLKARFQDRWDLRRRTLMMRERLKLSVPTPRLLFSSDGDRNGGYCLQREAGGCAGRKDCFDCYTETQHGSVRSARERGCYLFMLSITDAVQSTPRNGSQAENGFRDLSPLCNWTVVASISHLFALKFAASARHSIACGLRNSNGC